MIADPSAVVARGLFRCGEKWLWLVWPVWLFWLFWLVWLFWLFWHKLSILFRLLSNPMGLDSLSFLTFHPLPASAESDGL